MIKEVAWDAFKNTGDINTFLEYKQIQDLENKNQHINNTKNEIQEIQNMLHFNKDI